MAITPEEIDRRIEDASKTEWSTEVTSQPQVVPIDTGIPTTYDIGIQQSGEAFKEIERLNNVAQSSFFDSRTFFDKMEAVSNTWDESWLAKGYDYFKYDRAFFRAEDKGFKDNWNSEAIFKFMKDNNLHIDAYNDLKDAVSLDHANDLVDIKQQQYQHDEQIRNALTDNERLGWSLATSIIDADIVIGGAGAIAAKTLSRTEKASKAIALATAGTEIGSGVFISAIDEDTSLGEAMMIATTIGAVDYSVIRKLSKQDFMEIGKSVADAPTDNTIKQISDRDTTIKNSTIEISSYKSTLDDQISASKGDVTQLKAKSQAADELISEMYKASPDQAKVEKLYDQVADDLIVQSRSAEELAKATEDLAIVQKKVDDLIEQGVEGKRLQRAKRRLTKLEKKVSIKTAKTAADIAKANRLDVLTREIERRMSLSRKEVFKEINTYAKTNRLAVDSDAYKMIKQVKQDIMDISSDVEMNISAIKKDLQAYAKSDVKLGDEILSIYKNLHKKGFISKSAYDQIEYSYKKGTGKGYKAPKIEVKSNGVNKDMDLKINGKKVKKLPFAVGASMIATSAFSYDGSDLAEDIVPIMLAGFLGIYGIANAKTIAKHIAGSGNVLRTATARSKTLGTRAKIADAADKSRTILTETIKPLLDNTTGDVRDLVKKLYFDPVNTQNSVERIKNRVFHQNWNLLQKDMRSAYKDWLKETGTSQIEGTLNLFRGSSKRYEFDKMITEHIEYGAHSNIASIKKGAEIVNKTLDNMLEEMKGAGVKDIDKTTLLQNYVPRVVNKSRVQSILANATPASREAFVEEFAKMLTKTSNPLEVANVYVKALSDPLSGAGRKSLSSLDSIKKVADQYGFGDDVVNEIADALGVGGDKFGRLKNRIPMDKTKFEGVTIEYLDGSASYKAGLDDIFEQDIMNVMSDYLNKASGQVAFADMGYASIDNALEVVSNANVKPSVATTLVNDIQALSGSPVIDYSDTLNTVMRSAGNYTIGTKMLFSTLSLASEAMVTAAKLDKSGWKGTLKSLVGNMRKAYGDDSFVIGALNDPKGMGLGMHQYGASFGAYKNLDEFGNITGGEKALSNFSKSSEVIRDFTLHVLPFVKTSDFLTKVNLQDSLQALYKHSKGEKIFKEYEKSSFAITPRVEELLGRLELNDKGYVKWVDFSKWSRSDRTDLMTTVDAMMQKRIQQATMGTTSAWSRNSALGAVASTLIKFPMSAYSNIGSFLGRGMLAGDPNAMTQFSMWLGGAAMATIARNEIRGRDYDENDIIIDAILQHPFAGAYGTAIGVLNPAPVQAMGDLQEVINIYNYK